MLRITCWTIFLSILLTIPVFSITVLAILLAIRLSKNAYQSFERSGTANPNNWCIEPLNGCAWPWLGLGAYIHCGLGKHNLREGLENVTKLLIDAACQYLCLKAQEKDYKTVDSTLKDLPNNKVHKALLYCDKNHKKREQRKREERDDTIPPNAQPSSDIPCDCRFNYPKPIRHKTHVVIKQIGGGNDITTRLSLATKRNDGWVNSHMKSIMEVCNLRYSIHNFKSTTHYLHSFLYYI